MAELEHMDGNEFVEWMAFNELSPIGEWRADVRAALICDTLAKCFGSKDSTLEDFILKFGVQDERPAAPEDLLAKAQMITMMMRAHAEAKIERVN